MAYVFNPTSSAQYINNNVNASNQHMIGMVASSSGTGRRWRMRYAFTVPVQMSELRVSFYLTATLSGQMSVGLTDNESTICPQDFWQYAQNNTVSVTFNRMLYPGKVYYLWLNYVGSKFESCYCYEGGVSITGIPAASTLAAENGTLGEEQTLTITAGSSEFTHDVLYKVGEAEGTVASQSQETEILWTPPLELAAQNTSGKSVECVFTTITYVDGKENARSETKAEYAIPESCGPTLTVDISAENGTLPDKFAGIYVQGYSRVKAELSLTLRYGATAAKRVTTIAGKATEHSGDVYTSGILSTSGMVSVSNEVVDSRGYSATATSDIEVQEYSPPLIIPHSGQSAIVCARATEDGVLSNSGTRLRIRAGKKFSSVAGENQCVLRYRVSKDEGAFGAWVELLAKGSAETEVSITTEDELLPTSAYAVELGAEDDVGESAVLLFRIPTFDVPVHLGHGGKNLGLGRYCDYGKQYSIDVGWDMHMDTGARIYPFPGEEKEFITGLGFKDGRLLFENVSVSPAVFTSDTTYPEFPYRGNIKLSGVTADMVPGVALGLDEALSGNFAPITESYDGGIYIYAAELPAAAFTIPTIICWAEWYTGGGSSGGGTGGTSFEVDETLTLQNGILSVNTTNEVEEGNLLPVTSAGVQVVVGNINALLETI